MGGAKAICKALKEEGKSWTNLMQDAQWVVNRCEECLTRRARGTVKGEPRHLPRPGYSGEVIGFDLKTVDMKYGPPEPK